MTPLLAHTSSLLATTWVASLWQGLALALLAVALLRLMPQASAALRHSILLAVFAAAVLLPLLRFGAHAPLAASQASSAAIRIAPWFAAGIAALWIAASAIRAVSLAMAWLHLRKVRRNAEPIAIEAVNGFTAGSRRAILCTSAEVDTPAILGFFRPVLLLPKWLAPTLSADELREIALHECEHLRRRDDWINLLLQIGLVLMPLNPALLWLNRRIGIQRELACDAAVIASTAKPIAYAASLTRLAEQRLQHNSLRLALAALGRKSELAQRVHALLREPAAGWSTRQSAAACTAAAVVLLAASAGLSRVPRMIRVADAAEAQSAVAVTTPAAAVEMLRKQPATIAPAAHMVATSFEVKPPVHAHHKATHRAPKVKLNTVDAVETLPKQTATPRFVRTASSQPMRTVPAIQQDERPARIITTEFTTSYVAVPVPNGWLLIEL